MTRNKTRIREVQDEDVDNLNNLMWRSKSHWGYDQEYLDNWSKTVYITPEKLTSCIKKLIETEDGTLIGFWIQEASTNMIWSAFFIDPEFIGQGYARPLWNAVMEEAKQREIPYFMLRADPNVKDFYIHMGGEYLGDQESSYQEGLPVPVFKIEIT